MTINKRIFVEKKEGFQTEAKNIFNDLKAHVAPGLQKLNLYVVYDIYNIEEDLFNKAIKTVFSEVVTDNVYESVELDKYIAYEFLPGQYDQRSDSAMQCVKLLDSSSDVVITSSTLLKLEGDFDIEKIKGYLINPIESREKDLSIMEIDTNVNKASLRSMDGFIKLDEKGLKNLMVDMSLAMSFEDLKLIQEYFISESRDPSETEIRVLDTYWSDHCRHTTFETSLEEISISANLFRDYIQEDLDKYLRARKDLNRENKPLTLMDLATINAKILRSKGLLNNVEISDEINACSVYVDVDVDGKNERWLMMFKNETHNHPTEVEPFGGASTCIGGAIRDPLSGRSYVYQAMRISGSGNVFTPLDETLEGKLSQRVISKRSSQGNSSYGNQIGLSTTYVKEIYHDSYVAKHLEMGAVVGAVKSDYVKRKKPQENDVIILLGGKTGRDGIGGATGSSKQHDKKSLEKSASEVQKGNAPEERKIQRLFRNPECTKLIKKCNDFGAGGVSVAIGELAEGLIIDLSKVKCKYQGLNETEIAISESQERMAVVVSDKDKDTFIDLAKKENLDAYEVARVTSDRRMVMLYEGKEVLNIKRDFIDSAGARAKAKVDIADSKNKSPFVNTSLDKEAILNTLKDPNVACQKGMVEMFDASISASSVLMPFGGKYQLTPSQVSIQKFPVLSLKTKTCSTLAYGFMPSLMEYSPYLGAMYSILISLSKTIASGNKLSSVHLSFQEYFEKLGDNPSKWGKIFSSLLGTFRVQDYFNLAAIGGKDSMSGTFNNLNVCPTLISIACTSGNVNNIISGEFKKAKSCIGVLLPTISEEGYPDLGSFKEIYEDIENYVLENKILSSYVVEDGGILAALFKQSFGNKLGFEVESNLDLLRLYPGAICVETSERLDSKYYHYLGQTNEDDYSINKISLSREEALEYWTSTFDGLYPRVSEKAYEGIKNADYTCDEEFKVEKKDEVKVLIPVFPGTNCEYDMARAFNDEGATSEIFVFNNMDSESILDSINKLSQKILEADILALPGGFSAGDEPDGSAKFIVNILQNESVKAAINKLLERNGLILGICNGFQALIKSGLLPYGEVKILNEYDASLFRNDINRHVSTMVNTRLTSNKSPWLKNMDMGSIYTIPVSHGEGKVVVNKDLLEDLLKNGQVAFQYCDEAGMASGNPEYNVNGSCYAIEGLISKDGKILGKMGHSERYVEDVFKNIYGNKKQSIFKNGVDYFKNGGCK